MFDMGTGQSNPYEVPNTKAASSAQRQSLLGLLEDIKHFSSLEKEFFQSDTRAFGELAGRAKMGYGTA